MPVRATMSDLITRTRMLIGDPFNSTSVQYQDQDYQDRLDANRDDIRYEGLTIAPTIANNSFTNGQPVTIFADYYSKYGWWEQDVVLQGQNTSTHAAWVVLTPVASDYITGHWQFELDVWNSGTAPGQYPPVFATGKVYDLYAAAADLLEFWAASLSGAYDVSVDGQSLRRSQLMMQKMDMAAYYRKLAKPKIARMDRHDVLPNISTRRYRLLDSDDVIKGA